MLFERPAQERACRLGGVNESPNCPRCGYDLSGHVASWERSCPIEGRCSECGLAFAWSDVFAEFLVGPRWSFEHAPEDSPPGAMVGRAIATMLMALRPARMWQSLRLEHEVRVRRLLVLGLAQIALLHGILFVLVWGTPRVFALWSGPFWPFTPGAVLRLALFPYDGVIVIACGAGNVTGLPVWVPLAFGGVSASMPLSMLLLPVTMRRIRVRRVHLLRGFVLGLPMVPLALGVMLATGLFIACEQWLPGTAVWRWTLAGVVLVAMAVLLVWYGYWWRQYLRYYIRMPQPTLTAVVLLVLCGTFVFVSSFVISVWS